MTDGKESAPAVRIDPDATVLDDSASAPQTHSVPDFPVRDWDRYIPLRLLGQGGMGTVFLARDVQLHRQVALKFVRGANPRHTAMLLVEARAQARVSHDRVCKVFEVGEVAGQIYIAMQYIDGQPLSVAARRMTCEQRAMAIRDAAEGVHEAHRAGILHRDIKPGNIMIERGEDGGIRTYVMDFGLASDRSEEDSDNGNILGTPHFMSPEQARGELGRLDRRADVYSLGASLYQILADETPIPGASPLEVLENIPKVEPRPLREWDRDIPADLDAIAQKCLQKDRSARYDSVRELVEDLDRFLNGEPVKASPSGAWYRLRKRVRKHRRLVTVGVLGLALVALALGWGSIHGSRRARLARRLSEGMEQIEAMKRYSALSRLHDIRNDQAKMLAKIHELEGEIDAAGPLAKGLGAYAIGRGYFVLGEETKARAALESAWEQGFHEPSAAYLLAVVLGHLYQRELLETERIQNQDLRSRRKLEIESLYRDPALGFLRQSAGADLPSKGYAAALMAYYEGRNDDALRELDSIGERLPWFYEAPKLRGDVLVARATRAFRDSDRKRARADLDAARAAYQVACSMAESVPALWVAAAALEYQVLAMDFYGNGEVTPPYERGIAAVNQALAAESENGDALLLSTRLHRRMAEDISRHGGNAEACLSKAINDATLAAAPASAPASARFELAQDHSLWGQYLADQSKDPREHLRQAEAILQGIPAGERVGDTYLSRGLVAQTWAEYEDQVGVDSLVHWRQAIDAYTAATKFDERLTPAWINLGTSHLSLASRPHAQDAESELLRAKEALDRARALDPENIATYFSGGRVVVQLAERARARGQDPRPELASALKLYREGIAISPKSHYLYNVAGMVFGDLATEAWDRGGDPESLLEQARASFDRSIELAPKWGVAYHNLAESWTQLARFRRDRGLDPESFVQKAVAAEGIALQHLGENATPWASLAEAHLIAAELAVDQGRDPGTRITNALSAATTALERNRSDATAHYMLGRTFAVRARWLAFGGQASAGEFEKAVQELQKAVEIAPEKQIPPVTLARLHREWALALKREGRAPEAALRRGLEIADALLVDRPRWPEALAARGELLLASAELSSGGSERRRLAQRALADLEQALAGNGNLETRWRSSLQSARQLAETP